MWYYRLIAFLTALDLIGKSAVEALPEKAFPRELPPGKPLLLLKRFHNEGLPLGFLAKRREIVLGGPLIIESLVLFRFSALLPKRGRKYEKTALALVLAGGASNLFDRFFRGFVVDYLSLRNRKAEHLVFNLGDCFIALGMGLTAALELARGLKRLISKKETSLSRQDLIQLCLLVVLLGTSALFSSAETALTTVNRIRVRTLASQGDKRAVTLLSILQKPEKMLSVILIGNNVVNLYASSLATTVTLSLFGSKMVGVATGVLTLAVLVFGEVAPKTMASRNAERIALCAAGPVRSLMWLFTPLVFVVNNLARLVMNLFGADRPNERELMTAEELRTIVQVGHEDGVLENDERKIIDNVFDFGDRSARDIMIPRIDMTCIDIEASKEELMEVVREEQYTRIPVYKDTADTIVGILNVKDLLFRAPEKNFRIAELMRKPLFTYEQKKTSELMVEMRKNYTNLAIVLDEYGVTAGMVTMEDILEEIVGEIRDEYDRDEEKSIRRVAPNTYLVEGNVKIDDLNEALQLKLSSEDYESIGGYVLEQLEHFPKEGESVVRDGMRFTVTRMEQTRIAEVKLTLAAEKAVVK